MNRSSGGRRLPNQRSREASRPAASEPEAPVAAEIPRRGGPRGPRRPPRETRREKFLRVVPPRVKAAAKALELVGYGGSRERYVYNPEDAKAIERYLRDAFDKAMAAYGIVAHVQLGGIDPELVTKTVDAVLTEAEGEITAHSKRILNEMKAKVAELQKKAIEQAEQAALMVAEAERDAAKAGEQVIAQGEAEAQKVRDEVLKKVRSRIVADLGAAISTPTQPKPDSLEAILFGKG